MNSQSPIADEPNHYPLPMEYQGKYGFFEIDLLVSLFSRVVAHDAWISVSSLIEVFNRSDAWVGFKWNVIKVLSRISKI